MRMTGCSRVFLRARGLHRTGRPVSPRDSSALGLSAGDSVGEPNFSEGGTQDPVRGVNEAITPYLIKKITRYEPPKFIWRTLYTFLLLGLVIKRVLWQLAAVSEASHMNLLRLAWEVSTTVGYGHASMHR